MLLAVVIFLVKIFLSIECSEMKNGLKVLCIVSGQPSNLCWMHSARFFPIPG